MNGWRARLRQPFRFGSWRRSVFSVPCYCGRGRSASGQVASLTLEHGAKPPRSRRRSTICQSERGPSTRYSESAAPINETALSTGSDEQIITCPRCAAPLTFFQACLSRIEACGFENYSLDCPTCYSHLEGLFDPADGALLLSESAPSKAA
jgi:hypothetical protein